VLIVHTIATLSRQAAGVFSFVNVLAKCQKEQGFEVVVLGLRDAGGLLDRDLWRPVKTVLVDTAGPGFFPIAHRFGTSLEQIKPDLVHCHGLWTFHGLAVPAFCRRNRIPYLVSPHGMLEPWAWRHHAWKKRPIWWAWEKRFLTRAAVLHATADQEAANLRHLDLPNPIVVVPVGVDLPPISPARNPGASERRTLLFLSRIHPKKGLLNLVEAWRQLHPKGWRVVIAGPDEDGHRAVVEKAIRMAGLDADFNFVGPVNGVEKWTLLQSADLFALPTYSENFGVVIAEALACGVPVITTKGTPWNELLAHRCGWWVDAGAEPLATAMREAIALTDEQRREMGKRGRCLVEERYSWPKIAVEMKLVYEWVLGGGTKPECVV
jgi:glycosyltransferase involved in cell wall biosynthesis